MESRRISITRPINIRGGGCANRLAGISHEEGGPSDRDGMADAGGKRLLNQWEGVNSPSRFRPYLHQAGVGGFPKLISCAACSLGYCRDIAPKPRSRGVRLLPRP